MGRKKKTVRVIDWWEKVTLPVKRAWVFVTSRVEARRKSMAGIMKLHNDVQMCGYEDVQVMWEMLRSEMELSAHAARRRRPFWRVIVWSGPAVPPDRRRQPSPIPH
ncbi:unnamed protein product [Spirodela intermedia]|uniref:Uncharacterized protein n=2 Tax=Spirodela intermedia TaxID=51605 RepID=A0A7I8JJK5_SPIIN|nr:unnamed protein product [Spirodela intermedia]CAA6670338.1 unnamed protein product [Spirodela intermedia]CAA7407395.1 unnamed protein product [Spirodela intermedia]